MQNVESLAHAGLRARFGDLPGTRLISVSEAVAAARGANEPPGAVLLGGAFGARVEVGAA